MASIAYLDLIIGGMVTLTMLIAVPLLLSESGGCAGASCARHSPRVISHGVGRPGTICCGWVSDPGLVLLLKGNRKAVSEILLRDGLGGDAEYARTSGWIVGTVLCWKRS